MTKRDEVGLYKKIKKLGLTPNEYFYLVLLQTDNMSQINFDRKSVEDNFLDKGYDNPSIALSLIQENVEDITGFCEEYRLLFPKGKLPSGSPAKSTLMEIKGKMKWFLATFDYEKEVILEVTKNYINHYSMTGYKYMQTASYFILKENNKMRQSRLADLCEEYMENNSFNENFGIDV